jgi:hypothetical protein
MNKNVTGIDQFIDKNCYDAMYAALSHYIEDNPGSLELDYISNFVEQPDGASLIEMEINKSENCVIDEDEVAFDVIVSCEIEIVETVSRNRETDSTNQWFRMHCKAVLADMLKSFTVPNIEVYSK